MLQRPEKPRHEWGVYGEHSRTIIRGLRHKGAQWARAAKTPPARWQWLPGLLKLAVIKCLPARVTREYNHRQTSPVHLKIIRPSHCRRDNFGNSPEGREYFHLTPLNERAQFFTFPFYTIPSGKKILCRTFIFRRTHVSKRFVAAVYLWLL